MDGIAQALSPAFTRSLEGMQNPYDRFRDGMTSRRIKDTLKTIPLSGLLMGKEFRDLV
jgi:UDP-N-acetylglucosamine 2-epimerase (non-hydrolysing)/GDP/UDP-N,N'-diacetylbacillosamine 2-epimerase (hydrolysing)